MIESALGLKMDSNGFKYFEVLDDIPSDYKAIKVWSVLQFFTLAGKKTTINVENVIPITDLAYVIFSPHENRYYLRFSHGWTLDQLYFYRRTLEFSGEEESIESLRRYVSDSNLFLLLTETQVQDTTAMLKRLYKSQYMGEGKVSYRAWISLLKESLDLDDYRDYGKNLTGYRTICNQFEKKLRTIWEEIYKSNQNEKEKAI